MSSSDSQPTSDVTPRVPPIQYRRPIVGMSAILLPVVSSDEVDWKGFRDHVSRTLNAGLIPAINMDTGYANLIPESIREKALDETQSIAGEKFVSGVYVGDQPGDAFNRDAYAAGIDAIQQRGGMPILFQSFGLTQMADSEIVAAYQSLAEMMDRFLAFELGTMFAPFGKIYSLDVYEQLMRIESCQGAKHSSLNRELEWQRLSLRDNVRPSFQVLTGNDLAIDMVMYGSDYLLGLSTFAPEAFGRRDAMWQSGDPGFYELNDWLQYLGFLAFRDPVPAYKHNAAQFLHARGWIASPDAYPGSPTRPDSDVEILRGIMAGIDAKI